MPLTKINNDLMPNIDTKILYPDVNEYLKGTKTIINKDDLLGIINIPAECFRSSYITTVILPDTINDIGTRAFEASKLETIQLSKNIKTIGNYTFRNCTFLTNFNFPELVINITQGVFQGCTGLTLVTLSSQTIGIGTYAFQNCSSLSSITFPATLTAIQANAFNGCTGLIEIISLATTPPEIQSNTFTGVPDECVIKVPASAVEAYKAAPNWSLRADYIIPIEE